MQQHKINQKPNTNIFTKIIREALSIDFISTYLSHPSDITYIFANTLSIEELAAIKTTCRGIKKLKMYCHEEDYGDKLKIQEVLQMQSLEDLRMYVDDLDLFLNNIGNLKNIKALGMYSDQFSDEHLGLLSEIVPRLKELQIQCCSLFTVPFVEKLSQFKFLQHLRLESIPFIEDQVMDAIVKNLSHLKALQILGCELEDPQSLEKIKFLKELQKLTIQQIQCQTLQPILQSLPHLKELTLSQCSISSIEIGFILKNTPLLKKLELVEENLDQADFISLIEGLPHLKSIFILSNPNISAITVQSIAANLPQLLSLNLFGCNVGDLGLSTLSVSMIALKELYLQNCGVTEKGVTYLRRVKTLEELRISVGMRLVDINKLVLNLCVLRVLYWSGCEESKEKVRENCWNIRRVWLKLR